MMEVGIITPDARLLANGARHEARSPSTRPEAKPRQKPVILDAIDPRAWTIPAPQRQWVVPDWIPRGVVTALYGDGGTGKSLIAQQLLTSTTLGAAWLGLETCQGSALRFFCEDDLDELHRRQDAINAALGVQPAQLGNLRFISRVGENNALIEFSGSDIGSLTPLWYELHEHCQKFQPSLLVLDTAADFYPANENDRGKVRQFIQNALAKLAREHSCAVLLCAHPSQSGMASGGGGGGSTAWSNTVRSRLYFEHAKAGDDDQPAPDRRVLTRKKANYAARDGRIDLTWRNGVFVIPEIANSQALDATWEAVSAMLDMLEAAWRAGKPLSGAPQTKDQGRYFPLIASRQLGVPEKCAKALLRDWLANGCIVSEEFDRKRNRTGLRVVRRPDLGRRNVGEGSDA